MFFKVIGIKELAFKYIYNESFKFVILKNKIYFKKRLDKILKK